jgi:fatty acid desaturase
VGVGAPHVLGILLSGTRPYLEHADTGLGTFQQARSYCSPIMTALFAGNNFHLEHHLYPSVPCFRLPAVHRWLRDAGVFEGPGVAVEPGFFSALGFTRAAARYPEGSRPLTAGHDQR